jgi:hypothetical protein
VAEVETPTEFAHGDGYIVSTWRNVLMMMWTTSITHDGLDATERAGKMLERRYKDNQVAVSVSLPKITLPDEKVRAHAGRLLRERSGLVKITVTVIEGEGFWLSAGRMVMTALTQISGSRQKSIIAKSVDEVAPLVHPLVTPKASLAEVARAVQAFRG